MMNPTAVGTLVFAGSFGGALVGFALRPRLPEHLFSAESKSSVQAAMALVTMMTALILGLVTAAAKGTYDETARGLRQIAGEVLVLDRLLARYGPETMETRRALKLLLAERVDAIWPLDHERRPPPDGMRVQQRAEMIAAQLRHLVPQTDDQQWLKARAVDLSESLLGERWAVFATRSEAISAPFLAILLFWLTIAFTSFGLLAPPNFLVVSAQLLCALSIGAAVFLIMELDSPFGGLLKVSADPLRYALAHIAQ